ncbi:GT2 family glycosyltransferase [Azospirillum lipoferum]|uniref:Glycosyltransferase n=1 Tax=Azospirillum lipoferum TaxID=193 RepID=A0A5A9GJ34_AZOLI|nr:MULTISPECIES: glycosyltransferase [Azospirillum]KAA0593714.1 glycosyltransferase [Azospirillum lipoferum]MCP1615025.1 GT2 family glycosyltransferase [Azospirillum lipoferum]MDW5536930.1 glycosyltransferase [Azospirillum sp. NL1]
MDSGLKPSGNKAAPAQGPDAVAHTGLEDAFNGYRLFLGRHPNSVQEITAATGCTLGEFLGSYLLRKDFLNGVVAGLAGDTVLPHVALAPAPDDALARWVLDRLPLSDNSRELIATSRSWRFWLLTILRDDGFRGGLPAAVADWLARSGVQGRLAALELAPTRRLIGEASHSGTGSVSGWCANASDFSERVVLELHLGGRFIGAVRCEHFIPGLGERVGGSGTYGFVFDIPAAHADLVARGAVLRLSDAHSKMPFGSDIYVKANLPAALDDLGRVLAAIQSMKEMLANIEQQIPHVLRAVSPPLSAYGALKAQGLLACHRLLDGQAAAVADLAVNVILLETAVEPAPLRRLLASLDEQTHGRWILTVLATADTLGQNNLGSEARALIRPLEADGRAVVASPSALPRLLASHPALAGAAAHLVVGSAGTLRPDALAAFLAALEQASADPGAVAYSDHDVLTDARNGKPAQILPVFKPDFDPAMLLSYDYAGPMVLVTPDALLRAFAIADGTPPSGLHDLMLRLSDCVPADAIRHIPSVLYSLDQTTDLRGPGGLPRLLTGDPRAVEAWAGRRGLAAEVRQTRVISETDETGQTLVEPCDIMPRPASLPSVTVIVPTRNAPILLRNCLDSLLRTRAAYSGAMQILVIDHQNEDPDSVALIGAMKAQRGVDVMPYRGPFNWAMMNNLAAEQAHGDVLVFLNDDTIATDAEWLGRAVATLELPEVAVVGARLLYGDGSIQHAGVVTSHQQGAVHDGRGMPGNEGGYLGRNLVLRSAAAVTGACMVTRRSVFESVKGFDPSWPVEWNDIVYCMAVRHGGRRVVYDPAVCLYHLESKTRGYLSGQVGLDTHRNDVKRILATWGEALDDPFYSPAFNRLDVPFARIAL